MEDTSDASSVLSTPPASPLNPFGYPSPPPSQDSETGSQPALADPVKAEPAPARKKRKVEPKPRITRHLNLDVASESDIEDQSAQLNLLLTSLRNRRKIVVVAGAGISVSAGIPDFRSSQGLFSSLKKDHKLKASGKQLFDASVVYQDESMISSFHDMVRSLSGLATAAKPTAFHHLMARLAQDGRLLRLYTQNVDGIEASLPPLATEVPLGVKGPWPRTIQLHGGLEKMVCQKCRHTSSFQPDLFQGPDPPLCPACCEIETARTIVGQRSRGVGKLRPRIVLYNEHNPDEEAIGSVVSSDLRTRPDALVVVGTSLKIPGVRRIVKEMCRVVRGRKDGVTIWINHDSAPVGKEFENCWDLIIKGDCDDVAQRVDLKGVEECTASDVERAKKKNGDVSIVIPNHNGAGNLGKGPTVSGASGKGKKNPTQARKARPKKATQNNTIPFRVGKTSHAKPSKPTKSLCTDEAKGSKPMHPVQVNAARNNGPMLLDSGIECASLSSNPRLDNNDTICAVKVPNNMAKILN